MIQFHPSDILSSVPDKIKEKSKALPGVRVRVYVCASCVHVTYLATPGAVIAILASSPPGLDASAAGDVAALPRRPGRPVDVWRAGQVFITVPEEVMTTRDGNAELTKE